MITIRIPDNFIAERSYIIDMLFSEFLGLTYNIAAKDAVKDYEIKLENGKELIIRDHFFSDFSEGPAYLDEKVIPSETTFSKNQFAPDRDIPVIFGTDELTVERNKIVCGIDIFASSFFMLTRWEEYANKNRDDHGRFPASAALAYKEGFLHRAVVNEYTELLWNMLSYLKCGQSRRKRQFRIFATHDVDAPFLYATRSPFVSLKLMGGDLLKRKDPKLAFKNFSLWTKAVNSEGKQDHFNTFDYIMDFSEQCGLKSNFLFITDCKQTPHDGDYSIRHKFLRRLMARIHERGHDIGLHASYGSANNPAQTRKEFDILKTVCGEEGIEQESWTSRQHFLRWENPTTFNNLESAHLDYDSTLSYADAAGFRCGVCYEYPAFNILTGSRLNLRERPLLVMECSVIDERYMHLGTGEKAFSLIKSIKDICKRYNGDFTVLWHNTRFIDQQECELYQQMLRS